MMKIRFQIITLLLSLLVIPGFAQDTRTFETKVADALNVLPADNQAQYTKTIEGLVNLGTDVVPELARLYRESDDDEKVKLEYAFSGIGKYLSSASESVRGQFAEAFVSTIDEFRNSPLAIDLLEELTFFFPSDKLELLVPLLDDINLQMRVLDIYELHPGEKTGDILWSAAGTADINARFKIYKILGDPRFGKTDQVINPQLANRDNVQGWLSLNGMAQTGEAQYEDYLLALPGEEHNPVYADALMHYADVRSRKGERKEAFDFLKKIYETDSLSTTLRALAVHKMAEVDPAASVPVLQQAFEMENEEYAIAASHGLVYLQAEQYSQLKSSIEQTLPLAKADAIRTLTRSGWDGSISLARIGLSDQDTLVRAQAVIGLAEMSGKDAQKEVLTFLQNAEEKSLIAAGVTALKMSTDRKNIKEVAAVLEQMPDDKKQALIPLIAARGDQNYFDQILSLARSSEGEVQKTSIEALARLGTEKHIPEVLRFLANDAGDQTAVTQKTLDQMMWRSESKNWEPELLTHLEGNEKIKFIPLIGHLSGDKSQELAKQILSGSDVEAKNELLVNLGEWDRGDLIEAVYPLLNDEATYRNAFNAIMGVIEKADWTDVRKVLYLQKLYDQTEFSSDKNDVISLIGNHRHYYTVMTLGDYLHTTKGVVQNSVATAIMNVVMPGAQDDDGMRDSISLALLDQAAEVISGPDAVYFKENIKTYIESVSGDQRMEYVSMFNGKDLEGWHGFIANPIQLERMSEKEIAEKLEAANKRMRENWWVENGEIRFKGEGQNLVSEKHYKNFVMLVDFKIGDKGDSGIYLRGTPQVQIWDIARTDVGAEVGSGGLYNNQKHPSDPLTVADMPVGDWNHMKIQMMGEKVTVWLNGELVVDEVVLENFWDRSKPIFPSGPIELQAHGTDIAFKNLYIKEIPTGEDLLTEEEKKEGFIPLFNGYNLDGWTGNKKQYIVEDGMIVVDPTAEGGHGNLFTEDEYENFIVRFDFLLTPGANNGLGVHAPLTGDAAYGGKEIQILDNSASIYANLKPYQYHGSLYGIAAAERGYLNPVGEWNSQEVIIRGDHYKVILNGTTILDVNIKEATKDGTADGRDHPGLKRTKGHLGFLGHGSVVKFKNIRLKKL